MMHLNDADEICTEVCDAAEDEAEDDDDDNDDSVWSSSTPERGCEICGSVGRIGARRKRILAFASEGLLSYSGVTCRGGSVGEIILTLLSGVTPGP